MTSLPALVGVAVELRDDGRDRAPEQAVGDVDDGDVLARAGGRGGRLQADEAAADHDHVRGGGQAFAQLVGVPQVAQVADPVEVRPGDPQAPGPAADGQRQAREAQFLPVTGRRDPGSAARRVEADRRDRRVEAQVDPLPRVPLG